MSEKKFKRKHELIIILIAFGLIIAYNSFRNRDTYKLVRENKEWEKTGFQGETVDGLKQGEWINYFKNGRIAEIKNYKNDTLNGKYVAYTPTGDYQGEMNYFMGVKVDTYKLYTDGQLNLIEYMDSSGMKQGEFRSYYKGELSQIGGYLDNEFHGEFVTYHKNGKKKQIYYYDSGVKIGVWVYFTEDGDTLQIESYN